LSIALFSNLCNKTDDDKTDDDDEPLKYTLYRILCKIFSFTVSLCTVSICNFDRLDMLLRYRHSALRLLNQNTLGRYDDDDDDDDDEAGSVVRLWRGLIRNALIMNMHSTVLMLLECR